MEGVGVFCFISHPRIRIALEASTKQRKEGQCSQEWEGDNSRASLWFSIAHDFLLGLKSSL